MVIEALVSQFGQRFQHEKRAQVCMWFDEKQEFARLLGPLQEHLAAMESPPFHLLEYDPAQSHGQIWIKHQIYQELSALPPDQRKEKRFVAYLPLPEDRLDGPDEEGYHHLEFLAEYRIAGVLWRISGKRPTLFSFLRQMGVALPEGPSDQRKLWDGGSDSFLAKYVAKFWDRPAEFWHTTLTPELAQSRLLGDVDQIILDLAVDPEGAWDILQKNGLVNEFQGAIRDRFGFQSADDDPAHWVRELVTVLAATETFFGYGEPGDFPLASRLPPIALRENHVKFLMRWLRDAESRPAWDLWISEVESGIDLSGWAAKKEGLSFGFPHLVKARWQMVQEAFEEASSKVSATRAFFGEHGEAIRKESEFSRASHVGAGSWDLLESLRQFMSACDEALAIIKKENAVEGLARIYVESASKVDAMHLEISRRAMDEEMPTARQVADRLYAEYANALNQQFFEALVARKEAGIPGFPHMTPQLEKTLWYGKGKRAVIMVDGLRYDLAQAIKSALVGQDIRVEPMMAALPAVTSVGMTSLLPISGAEIGFENEGNHLKPRVQGKDMAVRQNRRAFLEDFGAACWDIEDLEVAKTAPSDFRDLLVVFGHDDLDHIGHGSADAFIRHLQVEVERLARLVRKLHRWGFPTVHIITDHGFVLLGEEWLPPEVPCDKEWCHVLRERFALVPAKADLPLKTFPFYWDEKLRVALPPGMAFFKAEKSFSHGGGTLQELIIPHVISHAHAPKAKPIGVEVVLPAYTLMQSLVKVTLRALTGKKGEPQQMGLFGATGRTLMIDVLRIEKSGKRVSVLADGRPREVRLDGEKNMEQNVTLFFKSALSFQANEILELDIRDKEFDEQFPPGGIKLTIGRNM